MMMASILCVCIPATDDGGGSHTSSSSGDPYSKLVSSLCHLLHDLSEAMMCCLPPSLYHFLDVVGLTRCYKQLVSQQVYVCV